MTAAPGRTVVSIAGPAGTGKSQLALTVVRLLGDDVAARVPMDWFIVPRPVTMPMAAWLAQPLRYDHQAVRELLRAPDGAVRLTPPFDFTTFTRSAATGERKAVPIRPVMVLDAMEPWPDADLTVWVETPAEVRRQRIAERDARWGTRVIDRWAHLEVCREQIEGKDHAYDLVLDGELPIEDIAQRIAEQIGIIM